MFQCQHCKKIFHTKTGFEKHEVEIHRKSRYTAGKVNCNKKYNNNVADKTEFVLLGRAAKEEKARKRTRGPYRKSISSSTSKFYKS